jgi:Flp pilus assembly pilin Flp
MILKLIKNQSGTAAVEYALLAVLIAAVVAATVGVLGTSVLELFSRVEF